MRGLRFFQPDIRAGMVSGVRPGARFARITEHEKNTVSLQEHVNFWRVRRNTGSDFFIAFCTEIRIFVHKHGEKGVKEHVRSASQAREYIIDPAHEPWSMFVQASSSKPPVLEHKYIMHLLEYSRLCASSRSDSVDKVICKYCIHLHLQCTLFECHAFRCQSQVCVL